MHKKYWYRWLKYVSSWYFYFCCSNLVYDITADMLMSSSLCLSTLRQSFHWTIGHLLMTDPFLRTTGFVSNGDFWKVTRDVTGSSKASGWHCDNLMFWGSTACDDLKFSECIVLIFDCNRICRVRYTPPPEPFHLRLLWHFCHSVSHHHFCFFVFVIAPLRQMTLTLVSHQ